MSDELDANTVEIDGVPAPEKAAPQLPDRIEPEDLGDLHAALSERDQALVSLQAADREYRAAVARAKRWWASLSRRYKLGPEDNLDTATGALTRVPQPGPG